MLWIVRPANQAARKARSVRAFSFAPSAASNRHTGESRYPAPQDVPSVAKRIVYRGTALD